MRTILLLVIFFTHYVSSKGRKRPPFYIPDERACGRRCRFHFCGFRQRILVGAPNVVQKLAICKLGSDLKDIIDVGEASVMKSTSRAVPISKWRPTGLNVRFRKGFFGVGEIPGSDNPGVFTRMPRGNQYEVLGGTCVVLPIKKYTTARFDGSPKTKISKGPLDCLSFNVRTEEIIIELEWFSGDDLDLSVREPDGSVINFRKLRSKCGALMQDSCVDCCEIFGSSRERVTYRTSCAGFQRGDYTAIVRHVTNCGLGPTNWIIRLIVDGVVAKFTKGVSAKDSGQFAGRMKLTL